MFISITAISGALLALRALTRKRRAEDVREQIRTTRERVMAEMAAADAAERNAEK